METKLQNSNRCSAPAAPARRRNCPGSGELGKKHETCREREGTADIGRVARSIGFSLREASEIERIYQSIPTRILK